MSTMGYYVNDVLDKYSGVQILSDAKIGSRTMLLATDGYCATGYAIQPWNAGLYTTISTAYVADTATANAMSTAYHIFHLGTAAGMYTLPTPSPGYNIKIINRSSDVGLKTCIGSGASIIELRFASYTSFANVYTSVAASGGCGITEFLGISATAWMLLWNNATVLITLATGT